MLTKNNVSYNYLYESLAYTVRRMPNYVYVSASVSVVVNFHTVLAWALLNTRPFGVSPC